MKFKVIVIEAPFRGACELQNALNDGWEIFNVASCHGEHGFIVYTLKKE
jgi:hypothetical protein